MRDLDDKLSTTSVFSKGMFPKPALYSAFFGFSNCRLGSIIDIRLHAFLSNTQGWRFASCGAGVWEEEFSVGEHRVLIEDVIVEMIASRNQRGKETCSYICQVVVSRGLLRKLGQLPTCSISCVTQIWHSCPLLSGIGAQVLPTDSVFESFRSVLSEWALGMMADSHVGESIIGPR